MKFSKLIFSVLLSWVLWTLGCKTNSSIENTTTKSEDSITSSNSNQKSIFFPYQDSITDSRDGETYPIVTIGKQIWMAENLRYETSGSWINSDYPSIQYGRLYNVNAAQTACPDDWHLPTDAEWNTLEMTLGMPAADTVNLDWRGTHSSALKSQSGWINEGNGTNSSGFNAFPVGYYDTGVFEGLGASTGFWTAIETAQFTIDLDFLEKDNNSKHGVWVRFLGAPKAGVNRFFDNHKEQENWGIACRCVKD